MEATLAALTYATETSTENLTEAFHSFHL